MDFDLTEQQETLLTSFRHMFRPYQELPAHARDARSYFAASLWESLHDAEFLDLASAMSPLEATLLVIESARLPVVAETAVSGLCAQMLDVKPAGPMTIISGDLTKAQRNLPIARSAFVCTDDDLIVLDLDTLEIVPVETILAYPYGRFESPPDLSKGWSLGKDARDTLLCWQRLAVAAEIAGAAQSAVEFTVDYVKQRHAFGRALGSFQAIQHRLAQCHNIVRAMYFHTLRAAWSQQPLHALMACGYAQNNIQKIVFDCHQFHGAIGLTTEHKLHFWTYRLRALVSDLGGDHAAHLDVAEELWGKVA